LIFNLDITYNDNLNKENKMNQELTTTENKNFNFEIKSLDQAMEYAKLISESDLAPKDYRGKPGNVLIAIQYGLEIGLKPMQAIQNIAVINGRPSIWGDAMIGIVQSHPFCEYIREWQKDGIAFCAVKRRGEDEHVAKFSKEDAKAAGLIGKPGCWTQYPDRMLQMRARGFALRDKFSDVLKGIVMREEVEDYQIMDINERKNIARDKISLVLAEKNNDLTHKLENAKTIEELKSVKSEIAGALKDKHAELLKANPETGEVTE
jgi:hypothetical protein